MAEYTDKLGLKKPERKEFFTVLDQNGNMDLIDQAFSGVEEQLSTVKDVITVTLSNSGWTGSEVPYKQTVDVPGMTASDAPILVKRLTGTETEAIIKAYNKAFGLIFAGESGDGTATFYAYKKPATDLKIGLKGI